MAPIRNAQLVANAASKYLFDIKLIRHNGLRRLFNEKANIFANMPYEWGQEKSGKHKTEYEKAKAEYEDVIPFLYPISLYTVKASVRY